MSLQKTQKENVKYAGFLTWFLLLEANENLGYYGIISTGFTTAEPSCQRDNPLTDASERDKDREDRKKLKYTFFNSKSYQKYVLYQVKMSNF